ncbi:uncharacterized protein LOC135226122 [Macrobrachium nipponense]|uniref:uncharacterized protein LOC135226122 n=1 Tax=Macrobrachium nipponense TaxID=159736 RepID=UPI0030C8AC1A
MPGKAKRTLLFVAVTLLAVMCLLPIYDVQELSNFSSERLDKLYRIKGPLSGVDDWLVKYMNKTHLFPPSTEPYNLSKDVSYSLNARGDTWSYIHRFLRKMFIDEPPGFFLEAGALDGEFLSNTLWLERTLGWTGLLIEPDMQSFRLLQRKHRKAWTSNACISKENYPVESYFVNLKSRDNMHDPWWYRMYYPANSHLFGTNITPDNITEYLPATEHYSLVQCFPLITFVQALGVKKIDFLSLDLQGNEKLIIRNFPWSAVKVRVVIIEDQTHKLDNDFIEFMKKSNYQLINGNDLPRSQDHVYINKDEIDLLEKFTSMKNDVTKLT